LAASSTPSCGSSLSLSEECSKTEPERSAIRSFLLAAPLDRSSENRQVMTEYPRRKPNPIVHLIRWLWRLFVIALIVFGIIALYLMLDEAWWYEVPILLVFGYFTYVLVRNRRRRVL
jgi:Flp pilus assembly protein TadB